MSKSEDVKSMKKISELEEKKIVDVSGIG